MAPSSETIQKDDGSWITLEFLQQVLQEDKPDLKVSVLSKDVKFAVGKGENYLSTIFRVEVQLKRKNSEVIEKCHLIVKGYPNGDYMQRLVNDTGVFDRELDMYHIVLPEIYNFVKKRLPNGSIPFVSANVYQTSRADTLVLEDMKYKGYRMANRKNLLDFPHCVSVVRNMARLHGMSAAFHQHNPDFLPKYNENFYCERSRGKVENFLPKQMVEIRKKVQSWTGFENYGEKMEKFVSSVVDRAIQVVERQDNRFNVLTHGDCWVNNYLFKYSSTGEIEEVCFIDFQLSRFGSPALDLCYFLYSSPTNEVRTKHMEQLLVEYHNELSCTLKVLGYNPEIFSFQDLKNEMKRLASYGFLCACSLLPVVLSDPEDTPDLADLTEEELSNGEVEMWDKTYESPIFKDTFQTLIPYFDKLGVFD